MFSYGVLWAACCCHHVVFAEENNRTCSRQPRRRLVYFTWSPHALGHCYVTCYVLHHVTNRHSLNIDLPDRLSFLASNNILTSHVSGHCSLFSNLYVFKRNRYCCQLPDDSFVRRMKLRVANKCV